MDRASRLSQLWTWLPAFRAVAETEHLPTAARTMHVSPSALSRSVAQLEATLGHRLFRREHRRLHLEPAGRELLAAVRDAMRRIDDGIGRVGTERPRVLRVGGDPAWVGLLLVPVAAAAGIELEHVGAHGMVRDALLRGVIDLALVEQVTADDLLVEQLGVLAHAVFGAPDLPFATCTTRHDVWPAHLPRAITLRAAGLDTVVAACRDRAVRAVLPVELARSSGLRSRGRLALPAGHLYLVRRHPLGTSAVEGVVPAIREQARRVFGQRWTSSGSASR